MTLAVGHGLLTARRDMNAAAVKGPRNQPGLHRCLNIRLRIWGHELESIRFFNYLPDVLGRLKYFVFDPGLHKGNRGISPSALKATFESARFLVPFAPSKVLAGPPLLPKERP